jgi:hypothetical protein
MKTLDDEQSFFFIHLHLLTSSIGEWGIEPIVERFDGIEDFRQDEIEQCPQFWQIVLEVSWKRHRQSRKLTWRGVPVKINL